MEIEALQDEAYMRGASKRQRINSGRGVPTAWASQFWPAVGMVGAEALSYMTGNPFSQTNAALIGGALNVASTLYAGATKKDTSSSKVSSTTKQQFLYGQGQPLSGKAMKQFERSLERGEDPYEASKKAWGSDYGTYIISAGNMGGLRTGEMSTDSGAVIHHGTLSLEQTPYIAAQLGALYNMAAVKTAKGRDGDQIDCLSCDLSIQLEQTSWNFVITDAPVSTSRFSYTQSFEAMYRVVVYLCKDVYDATENYETPNEALAEVRTSVQVEDSKAGKVRVLHVEDVVLRTDPSGTSGHLSTDVDFHQLDLTVTFGEDDIAVWDLASGGEDYTKCTRPELTVAVFQIGTPQMVQNTFSFHNGKYVNWLTGASIRSELVSGSFTGYDQAHLNLTVDARLNYKK